MISCEIPISIGELWDKYTILLIKKDNIKEQDKLRCVLNEIEHLKSKIDKFKINDDLFNELKTCNKKLWIIEDSLREKERNKTFDKEFIELARSVYYTNDNRAKIKKKINIIMGSNIVEVKSYKKYD